MLKIFKLRAKLAAFGAVVGAILHALPAVYAAAFVRVGAVGFALACTAFARLSAVCVMALRGLPVLPARLKLGACTHIKICSSRLKLSHHPRRLAVPKCVSTPFQAPFKTPFKTHLTPFFTALLGLTLPAAALVSCGYVPVSTYTKEALGERIYTTVYIPVDAPEFAVNVTDAVKEAIVEKFKGKITNDITQADSIIRVKNATHSISDLKINSDGLVTLKRVTVNLTATITKKDRSVQNISGVGSFDYSLSKDASSSTADTDAINEASKKALDDIIVKISAFTI